MASFADALRVLNDMKRTGVVEDYAVAGAMALVFWTEPIPTFDLDVLVFLPGDEATIVSLEPLYRWAAERGYTTQAEHVMIERVPVQFLPAHNELADEAIERAETVEYEGVSVRVVRPEHRARTLKRRERAAALMESGAVDRTVLGELFKRFSLET